MNPPLCFELKLLIITGYEHFSEICIGNVSDELDTVNLLDFLMIADGNGEQQLVIFAAVEGTGGDVHVHLLGHDSGLIVDGDILLIDATANT